MKKIILPFLLVSSLASAQMTFTGGPLNTSGDCQAVWASGDSALIGYDESLYRTIDGGNSWDLLNVGIPINCDPRVIEYADGKLFVATNNNSRMYTSTDFGDTFIAEGGNLALLSPRAGTSGPGISMIGGTLVSPSIYNSSTSAWDVAVSGSMTHDIEYLAQDTIWACSGNVSSGTTRYSHDNGLTWTDVVSEPNTDIGGGVISASPALSIGKVGSRILIGTVLNGFPILYSDDYGSTWNASNATGYYCYQILTVNDNLILARIGGGIFKSIDQGVNWTFINASHGELAIWKTDKLLSGNYEYDNYGEGALLKVHGSITSATSLIAKNGNLLSVAAGNIVQYDPGQNEWSVFQDTNDIGSALNAENLWVVGSEMYTAVNSFPNNGIPYLSTDNGVTFSSFDLNGKVGQVNMGYIGDVNGTRFIGSYGTPTQQPRISYSTDGGSTYTNAVFSNSIAYGLGGSGANFVENIYEAGTNVLVADFNAGYALSTNGGLDWTFSGGPWDLSIMATTSNNIYKYIGDVLMGTKSLKLSADDGNSWQNVPLTGLPNSSSGSFNGYYGVWNLNGKICTYNAFEAPRGIYEFDEASSTWSMIGNTEFYYPDWDGVTDLSYHNNVYYANWYLNGVYKSASGPLSVVENKKVEVRAYPNPTTGIFQIDSEGKVFEVYNIYGQLIKQFDTSKSQFIDIQDQPSGVYFLKSIDANSGILKIIKR